MPVSEEASAYQINIGRETREQCMRRTMFVLLCGILCLSILGCQSFNIIEVLMAGESNQVSYFENFENGQAESWKPNIPENWEVEEDDGIWSYNLKKSGPMLDIRRPTSHSVLSSLDLTDFELIVSAKCFTDPSNLYRDICLFFGYQDSLHYYYTHFSARSDDVHNIIAIVNGSPRKRISEQESGKSITRLKTKDWHTLKIKRNTESGLIEAYIDDMDVPILTANDKTFTHGKIGLGSFDDTGAFREVKIFGNLYQP